jgi:hypothetical protein
MDRDPIVTGPCGVGVLDNVLRWVANEEWSRRGTHLCLPLGICMRYMIHIHFPTSNNVAKYEALVNVLHIVIELGIR